MDQENLEEMYLNNVWRPNLSITGAEGLPPLIQAGNVLRPMTTVRCSMRLSPITDPAKAQEIIEELMTTNPPYNAKITLHGGHTGSGWCQKELQPWLDQAIKEAGNAYYGKDSGSYGQGGSIPFLKELEKKYPDSQIVALGVLGPNSNAHGPNEMINLPYVKKLAGALTHIIASCAQN